MSPAERADGSEPPGAERIPRRLDPFSLRGIEVLVTRPDTGDDRLSALIRQRGGTVIHLPLIDIRPPIEPGPLLAAIRALESFDWVVLTSRRGVAAFLDGLAAVGRTLPGELRVAAIGPSTAAALEERGIDPDLVPKRFVAEGLLAAMAELPGIERARILLPRPPQARTLLPEGLRALGAAVTEVEAYRTVLDPSRREELHKLLATRAVEWVVFTSSSAVEAFKEAIESFSPRKLPLVAVIGPATGATVREAGLAVAVESEQHTFEGLISAIEGYLRRSGEPGRSPGDD